jgi:hypothetical protein
MRVVLKYRSSFSAESTKKSGQRPTCTPVASQKGMPLVGDATTQSELDAKTALYWTRVFLERSKGTKELFQIGERRQFAHSFLLKARKKKM